MKQINNSTRSDLLFIFSLWDFCKINYFFKDLCVSIKINQQYFIVDSHFSIRFDFPFLQDAFLECFSIFFRIKCQKKIFYKTIVWNVLLTFHTFFPGSLSIISVTKMQKASFTNYKRGREPKLKITTIHHPNFAPGKKKIQNFHNS